MNLKNGGLQTDKLVFRSMNENDEYAYCELYKRVFSLSPWNEIWSLSDVSSEFLRSKRKKTFTGVKAEYDLKIAGFITGYSLSFDGFLKGFFYLQELFVEPDLQGGGIGGLLLERMSDILERRGINRIFLLTKSGTDAEKFYLKKGYRRIFHFIKIKGKNIYYKRNR